MKRFLPSWDALLIGAILLIAGISAQVQAQDAAEGKIVTINPDADAIHLEPKTRVAREPAFWIGIRGRSIESAVLRTHLQLAEEMGVVVEEIVPGSPSAKAGLRKHDIILRVNGDAVDNMEVLQSQVQRGQEKPLELTIIRLSKQENIVVVPEVRPEQISEPAIAGKPMGMGGIENGELMQRLMKQFGARSLGPGMLFQRGGERFNWNEMPSGVSVSIQRNNDGPVQITVKQGNTTWQIEGDDEAALEQLPQDVRPFVERMLNGPNAFHHFRGGSFDFGDVNEALEDLLPRDLGGLAPRAQQPLRRQRNPFEADMQQRIEALEKRLLELQEKPNVRKQVLP